MYIPLQVSKTRAIVSVSEILGHLQHNVDTFDSGYLKTRVPSFKTKRGKSRKMNMIEFALISPPCLNFKAMWGRGFTGGSGARCAVYVDN